MADDDFDLYGEDDSFKPNIDLQVSLPSTGFSPAHTDPALHCPSSQIDIEDPLTEIKEETAPSSPVVGSKRPREEDNDYQPDLVHDISDQIEQKIATVSDSNSNSGPHMNGNYGGRNMNAGQGGAGMNDALYVGDLQWVRIFLLMYMVAMFFSLFEYGIHVCFSLALETISPFVWLVRAYSGLRMKIFGK